MSDADTQPEETSGQLHSLDESLHAFYLNALFGDGRQGWSTSLPNAGKELFRIIPHPKERDWNKGDIGRLRLWLGRHFHGAEITVAEINNGMIVSAPVKTLDSWERDRRIGRTDAGAMASLGFIPDNPKATKNDPSEVLEYQLRTQIFSKANWKFRLHGGKPVSAECHIFVPQELADSLMHFETGECGDPMLVHQLAHGILRQAPGAFRAELSNPRREEGGITLRAVTSLEELAKLDALAAAADGKPSNVASLAVRRAAQGGVQR